MLQLSNFKDSGVLVQYKRGKSQLTSYISTTEDGRKEAKLHKVKGKIRGVVVAIGPGIIGWSLCSKKDEYNHELGIHIALRRASINEVSGESIETLINKIPSTLHEEVLQIYERSLKYFQHD